MGSAPSGFQILADAAPAAALQQQQIREQQRVQNQNKTGALLLDSINNASSIKPPKPALKLSSMRQLGQTQPCLSLQ